MNVEDVVATRVAEIQNAQATAIAVSQPTAEPTPDEENGEPGGVCSRGGTNDLGMALGAGALLGLVLRKRLGL